MGPRTRLIVMVAACGAAAVGVFAALTSLKSPHTAPAKKNNEDETRPPTLPDDSGLDLEPCQEKPGFQDAHCGSGSRGACWLASASSAKAWFCWPEGDAPAWVTTALAANVHCRADMEDGPFDGACTFQTPATVPKQAKAPPEPITWNEAYASAKATLMQMTADEKMTLMRGVGWAGTSLGKWWYVGNTAAIPRLRIPALNMQDAAGGFRTYWNELVGTVTGWPSLLSLASTWDPDAVMAFGSALGEEFAGKGANGILGPSVDVHRVARGGRNFELMSGEDPFLGSKYAKAYVQGVQSKGVFAVMKHWIFNSQETNRETESSVVDEKTAWELYYPPFQAAVEAGVSAAMCSYNRVDGVHSCSNRKQLQEVLKQRMGFRGFVQSDWWATHDTSLQQGLDQEMPSTDRAVFFSPTSLGSQPATATDDAATRILAVVHRMNLSSSKGCAPPGCETMFRTNVTTPPHVALARSLAMESIVLLKNKDAALPILPESVKSVAVIGSAAVATAYNPNGGDQGANGWSYGDYYSGGGSGHVVAGNLVNTLSGIKKRAALAGIRVIESTTDDVVQGVAAAKEADVAVVVGGTTSGESMDRANLNLDHNIDQLIMAVASVNRRTVVLTQIPGAVLMPWRDHVAAILALFLGGQETGTAWGAVLFGDHAPTGRLPITIPATEADTIAPGNGPVVAYTEGMSTGYRNRDFIYAFPFGHGLTYTVFDYLKLKARSCSGDPDATQQIVVCIDVPVKNVGSRSARTVAQLYLEFAAEVGHPAPILKGFQRTGILPPGKSSAVTFRLSRHDLSFYVADQSKWVEATVATAHIGESSEDIRQIVHLSKNVGTTEWIAGDSKPVVRHGVVSTPPPTSALRGQSKQPTLNEAPAMASSSAGETVAAPGNGPGGCSTSSLEEDCRATKCCSEPGMQCYRKNPWWAVCRTSCTAGQINPLEKKQFQTVWDCEPLGVRSPLAPAQPLAPQLTPSQVPHSSTPPATRVIAVEGGDDSGHITLRMKASDVPPNWQQGADIKILGSGGSEYEAEIVHMGDKPQVTTRPENNEHQQRKRSGVSPMVAVWAGILCLPMFLALMAWSWWQVMVRTAADEHGTKRTSFGCWMHSQAANLLEAVTELSTGFAKLAASVIAVQTKLGKRAAIADQPQHTPGGNKRPRGSPTQSPLIQ